MTHEELLAICTRAEWVHKDSAGTLRAIKALRAVVELHKPIEEDGKLWCRHEACYNHIEFLERDDCECDYPCPTIQVIKEQLK